MDIYETVGWLFGNMIMRSQFLFYLVSFIRVACLILALHDISDVFLEGAKVIQNFYIFDDWCVDWSILKLIDCWFVDLEFNRCWTMDLRPENGFKEEISFYLLIILGFNYHVISCLDCSPPPSLLWDFYTYPCENKEIENDLIKNELIS